MPHNEISVDEFLSKRKDFVKSGDILMKAVKSPASWNQERRSARFVMSTDTPDRDNDIIVQAGINLDSFMQNPVALAFHNSRSWPLGSWSNIEKILNGRPKRLEGDLNFIPEGDDVDADRMAKHVAAGTIRACSIGFIPMKLRQRERDNDDSWPGYEITESELVECSIVPIPANPQAIIKDAAGDFKMARDTIEEILDTWAKHPATGLLMPRAEYEAAMKTLDGNKSYVETPDIEAVKTENLSLLERIKGLFVKAPIEEIVPPTEEIVSHEAPKIADEAAKSAASERAKATIARLKAANRI